MRIGGTETVFVAERGRLAEHAVDDLQPPLARRQVLQWNVLRTRLLFMEDRVTVAEGAASHILPAHAHVIALEQQGAQGKHLATTPVHTVLGGHRDPIGVELGHFGVHFK